MSDSKATKAQNLARIRDNQRRSRARRKEYLQELEAKLRVCEQQGVEASAEIQNAARKVLDDNRKLKNMLRARGVPEADIAAELGGNEASLEHSSSISTLTSMLDRRWPCTSGPCTNDSLSDTQSVSPTIVPQTPAAEITPLVIPPQPSIGHTKNDSYSPVSVMSGVSTPPSYTSAPFYPQEIPSVPGIKSEPTYYVYDYDQAGNNAWQFSNDIVYTSEPSQPPFYDTTTSITAVNSGTLNQESDFGYSMPNQISNAAVYELVNGYQTPAIRM